MTKLSFHSAHVITWRTRSIQNDCAFPNFRFSWNRKRFRVFKVSKKFDARTKWGLKLSFEQRSESKEWWVFTIRNFWSGWAFVWVLPDWDFGIYGLIRTLSSSHEEECLHWGDSFVNQAIDGDDGMLSAEGVEWHLPQIERLFHFRNVFGSWAIFGFHHKFPVHKQKLSTTPSLSSYWFAFQVDLARSRTNLSNRGASIFISHITTCLTSFNGCGHVIWHQARHGAEKRTI
jgi:hypothetical protein